MLAFKTIPTLVEHSFVQIANLQSVVKQLLVDSRKLLNAEESLFFAIRGKHHDGHSFIPALYEAGVRNFVIENLHFQGNFRPNAFADANIVVVESAVEALQIMASYHRKQFTLPVVGITGSNAKTIVKEWLYQLLQGAFRIVRSPRSYNSQIGVPLSVWQIQAHHNLGVFEAGISQPDEMAALAQIIQPQMGLLTNIGTAHDEGFESREEKVAEKAKLFLQAEWLLGCLDTWQAYEATHALLPHKKCLLWSRQQKAALQILQESPHPQGRALRCLYQGVEQMLLLPFGDEASVENALHCVVVMLALQCSWTYIQEALLRLRPVSMRLEMKKGINDCYLIDDSYNNDLGGLKIALDLLQAQKQSERKTLILSDVLESGLPAPQLYGQIAEWLRSKGIERFIGIGPELSTQKDLFEGIKAEFFVDTQAFLAKLKPSAFRQEVLLIKGARRFSFEKIIELLQYKAHRTVLEINLDAMAHNLNYYRSLLAEGTKVMAMVKAFAYGSGAVEVANFLQFHRVDYLAVAYTDEGAALRAQGIRLPIMVLNPHEDTFYQLFAQHLEPEIYSFRILEAFLDFWQKEGKAAPPIHLKLDTGMHRLGFVEEELPALCQRLAQYPNLRVASLMSHLAGADEARHSDYSLYQIETFRRMADYIEEALGYRPLRHMANSPAIVRFPEAHLDMVRLGIGLYGIEPNLIAQKKLRCIGTLKTVISQIKSLKKGDTVGYSRQGKLEKDSRIATIAIGYADGFSRAFSKGVGKVKIGGKIAPIIGNVCMDMCMVDLEGIEAQEGDEVIIFDDTLSIQSQAEAIGTIAYELLTAISERVRRVFYME